MKTRGRFLTKFLCLGLTVILSGCGLGVISGNDETTQSGEQEEFSSLSPAEKLADGRYFYREAARVLFDYEEPDNTQIGGNWLGYMGAEGMGRYASFFPEGWDYKDCYSVIQLVNQENEVTETEISFAQQGAFFGIEGACCDMFSVMGQGGIGLVNFSYPDPCQVCIVDEEGEVKARFAIPEQITEAYKDSYLVPLCEMIADAACNLYVAWRPSDGSDVRLLAVDSEGEKLWEDSIPGNYFIQRMTVLPDGRPGCVLDCLMGDEERHCILAMDYANGAEVVTKLTEKEIKDVGIFGCYDENTLLYSTPQGLYRCSYEGKNSEELYQWAKNGVKLGTTAFIEDMRVQQNGDIELFLNVSSGKDMYLRLELATEEKEVLEVAFAVAKGKEERYRGAVADFNRDHGDCKINMVVYEEQTRLLTELASGKGPILVDTSLVSFRDNENLWECLDNCLEEWRLQDVLLANVLQGGQIDGKQYGLSFSWSLFTFGSVSYQKESWDYEQFLNHLKNTSDLEMLFEYQTPEAFLRAFLCRSLEESYLVDPAAGRAYFDTERFTDAVDLANRLAGERERAESSEAAEQVRSGRCLGEIVALSMAEETALYDMKFGDQFNYVGLPGKAGSCHYIHSENPLAVRTTGSEEEKAVALAFLEQLLSKDVQKELVRYYGFSVRQDVFWEQLENMREELVRTIDGAEVRIPVDKEQAKERLWSLYEKAVPYPDMPQEIYNVLAEELSQCFHGTKSVEEVGKTLQNRVQLYLDEQK